MASPKKTSNVIAPSVISYYSKYKHSGGNIKSQVNMGTKFEMDDRYDVIDISSRLFSLFLSLFKI